MATVNIYNLTLIKKEKCNKKTINTTFNNYAELTLCVLPIMVKLNGKWILRDNWSKRLKSTDIVEFYIIPQGGGGGSDIVRIVAMIAVIVVAVAFAPEVAVAMGVSEAVAFSAMVFAGTMAVNTLLPPPMPKVQGINYNEKASPTYSLQAQGNSARIGDSVPVVYGRHMIYADFAAIPYSYFENNDQYLNQLFVIGMGEYDIEKIRIEDTNIANFKEITYEIIKPNQPITLFNHNCVQATEVASQTLKHDEYQGGFTLNKAASIINAIEVDFVASRGLYYADNNGNFQNKSVTVVVEARQIDEEEQSIGEWQEIINQTITSNKNKQIRKTFKAQIPQGRYEVRAKRTTAESTDTRTADTMVFTGLRGYLVEDVQYKDMTLVAMKMRATDNLSQTTSRKVNFIVTRKLPIWSAETGWSEPQVTRSIAWAFADVCRASYGGNLADDEINLRQLAYLDKVYEQNGDAFNAVFDSRLSLLEALGRIGKTSRTFSFIQAGKIHFVRDFIDNELDAEPAMVFNKENIVEDSWKIQYLLPTSETIDYAEITYFDEKTWTNKTFEVALDESKKTTKTQMTMFGVTNKAQAEREARYHLLCNKYRRRIVSFDTEMEGGIPTIGSLVRLSYPLPKWGISGFVIDYDAEAHVLTLNEPVELETGKEYHICLRNQLGKAEKPIRVERPVDLFEREIKLTRTPDFAIYIEDEKEKTGFIIGEINEVSIDAKVNSIVARDPYLYTITATIDDSRVYE
jgi:hypothetical protein